jgi:alpha-D-ribose 1-methylphosphonate 5-triphosphate diphosphatase
MQHGNIIITNARAILPEKVLNNATLVVENGKIADISPNPLNHNASGKYEIINAHGRFVMPGLIDIHTDAMDTEICPRSRADFPIKIAFRELERKMINCGITTVYHSLHYGYELAERTSRSKYSRKEVFNSVFEACSQDNLINNKIHLRFELTGVKALEETMELVRKGMISLYSVMDHTPGQGQLSFENFLKYSKSKGHSEEQARHEMQRYISMPRVEKEELKELVQFLREHNVPVASHDDDCPEKVREMHAMGIDICEFPINMETAREATALGMHSVGGAANVLRGGSIGGNLNVQEAISARVVNSLCSDYYPAAMLYSIFKLEQEGIMGFPEAVNLATLNPAKLARIDSYTGSMEKGKDADLIIVETNDNLPFVTHTVVGGKTKLECKPLKCQYEHVYNN